LQFKGSGLKLQFVDRDVPETVEEDEGSLREQIWMMIAVTASWDNDVKNTIVSLFSNNDTTTVLRKNKLLTTYAIEDSSDYEHFIGVDKDDSKKFVNFFEGFIYKICIS